jgi:hypothetical protein
MRHIIFKPKGQAEKEEKEKTIKAFLPSNLRQAKQRLKKKIFCGKKLVFEVDLKTCRHR